MTDYDCWKEEEGEVTVETVVVNMEKNISNAKGVISRIAAALPNTFGCACGSALAGAIMTDPKTLSPEIKEKYKLLAGKYI